MLVTGYKLQHTLRELKSQRDIAASQFSESLFAFPDENKATPTALMDAFNSAEEKLAALETAQQRYNQSVEVTVLGRKMSLSQAIKRVGGAGRAEKMWRTCASDKGRDRYSSRDMTRNKDEERATRQISVEDAMQKAKEAGRFASALRAAIAEANSTKIEIEGLDAALFE